MFTITIISIIITLIAMAIYVKKSKSTKHLIFIPIIVIILIPLTYAISIMVMQYNLYAASKPVPQQYLTQKYYINPKLQKTIQVYTQSNGEFKIFDKDFDNSKLKIKKNAKTSIELETIYTSTRSSNWIPFKTYKTKTTKIKSLTIPDKTYADKMTEIESVTTSK